jgi:hypothetical protein
MRYYKVHDLIACISEYENLLLKSYEVEMLSKEANLICLPLDRSPSDAVSIRNSSFKLRTYKRGERKIWELYGNGYDFYLILEDLLITQGASFVHGAAIEYKGNEFLFWGHGGVGKTIIALAALRNSHMRILADDVAIIHKDGKILSFHKSLAIYPYHLPLLGEKAEQYKHLLKVAKIVTAFQLTWRLGRKIKHRILSSESKNPLKNWIGKMNPGWVAVMPQELFHPQQLAEEIPIRASIMLTRESTKWSLNEMSLEEFTQLVIPITYTELEMAKSLFDYSSTGLI